ncbi:type VI secretion system membrane subunit TssM [Vibrio coralliilyticus]|uniref:type VI secretion system membrane subunit TssM n=1 Tax=Vibrio coralliilyticus TaxID=190893 RepID=UPI00148BD780|nr:type VI secretion system membrane subunit TssM [Vibrio coralliilyticus]NOI29642.1 type VI secretion system membrane subunit TssM [Vibrio coralliilyticus]NOI48700.1 type VI secretion system membrane subunit TssM [Vibrio coralliilyticus]
MLKNIIRHPIFISTLLALVLIGGLTAAHFLYPETVSTNILYIGIAAIALVLCASQLVLFFKKRKQNRDQQLETEEEALSLVLRPLLVGSKKKPIYLMIGNKAAGKKQFLTSSNAIKSIDTSRTKKNDFFEWYESDEAVYLKPDQRLVFQEVSAADSLLWDTMVAEVIRSRPRKPFSGCLFFTDLEFLIISEEEQIDYALTALIDRITSICDQTNTALPVYMVVSKLDKLQGFKEYVQLSPLKHNVEYLSIALKDAKGVLVDYYRDSFNNLVKVIEKNALDSTSQSNDTKEKQAILSFPKQLEICQKEVEYVVQRLSEVNRGAYFIDLRELFFSSCLQGGRKYNLLAKSCSTYFNLPIIASEHTQLSETPYFTRFLVESQILPEADFAGENKTYLKRILRQSRLAMIASIVFLAGGAYLLGTTLDSNLRVIYQLLNIETGDQASGQVRLLDDKLAQAITQIEPVYDAWVEGSEALDEEIVSLNVSRLEPATKMAYQTLLQSIQKELIPVIEQTYRVQLTKYQDKPIQALPVLKGYLMLKEPSKRDLPFMTAQTQSTLSKVIGDSEQVASAMKYLNAYFRTDFAPVNINMDIVRATRRNLLAQSNVDLVYAQLINQANSIDLGTLNIERAVGFDFNNVFNDQIDQELLDISKVYTATGFSTFYRPRVDLMSKDVITNNWVLGLSKNVTPSKEEHEAFKDQIRKKYTDDYISYWRNALSELKVKKYNSIGELTNAIDLVSGPSSPLTTVLKQVYSNTHFSPTGEKELLANKLPTAATEAIDKLADSAEEFVQPDYLLMQRVEQAFFQLNRLQINETPNSPTPWDEIVTALSRLRTYMKDIADSPDPQMASLLAARSRMQSSEADPIIRLKQIAQKSPEPVRSWLLGMVQQSWSVMIAESAKGVQTQWYSEVYTKYRDLALNKYPFDLNAEEEIALEDFELLFSTGGIIDTFVQKNLASFYDTNLWTPKRVDGETMPLTPELLVQLKNYNVIRDTLINKSTNRVSIPFTTKILDLDSSAIRATVKVADSQMSYYHGPSRIRELEWPPKSGDFNVSITIQDVTDEGKQYVLSENGQWAIYRLLGQSTLTNQHDGSFVSDITVSGRDLKLRVKPLSQRNPFTLAELYNFSLPETIDL